MLALLFLFILVSDQLTKHQALKLLTLGEPIEIIPGFFNLTLVFNPGAAFGMFSGLADPWRHVALSVVTLGALGIIAYFLLVEAKDDRPSKMALVTVLAGAIGNLIDRFRFDAVVDFLDFYIGNYHWPAFNVADSAICIGVTALIIRTFSMAKCGQSVEKK